MRLRSATLLAVAAAMVAAVPASATTSQEAVNFLNQQRAANGIPASAVFDDYRTTGCKNHNNYMAQNGGLQHGEQQGNPGYTPEGADYNNIGEVLAQGGPGWSASTNPWDAAPLHQAILFDPRVGKSGYDESQGFACMRLELQFSNPNPPVFYAYTGNLGPQHVPPREVVCCEGPYAPQEAVGIDQGVPTGPNIIFFSRGFGFNNHATSFSLKGPGGAPVDAKLVDSTTPPPPQGQGYKAFYTGGDLIPVQPLDPFTDYTATVTWVNDDDSSAPPHTQTVTFKTDGFARGLTLTLSKKLGKGRKATLEAPGEAIGQKAKVKIRGKTSSSRTITLKASQKIKVPKPRGHGRTAVTVTVKSFVLGDTRFTVTPAKRSYR